MTDRRCRCYSRRQARRCCAPLHAGATARTPTALMPSRFSAYALGLVNYILDTTDPEGPQWVEDRGTWVAEVRAFSASTQFRGLAILDAPDPSDNQGFVTFRATLQREGRDVSFTERSRFVRREGRWLYHSGEPAA